jgi:hypothetical protein
MTADLSQINQSRGLAWAEHVELGDPCDQCGSIVGDYHVFGWRLAHRSMTPRHRGARGRVDRVIFLLVLTNNLAQWATRSAIIV